MKFFIIIAMMFALSAETLFEVKDASNNKVLDVSTDGLRILNNGDTLMVISPSGVRVNLDNSKALSRTFTVATSTSKGKGFANVLEVGTNSTTMREGGQGQKYTNFSPLNMFLGLNAGTSINGGKYNIFIGNYSGNTTTGVEVPDMFENGYYNTFLGYASGRNATNSFYNTYIGANSGELNANGSDNTFVGTKSGAKNTGSGNTFLGYASGGFYSGSGYQNTFIGGLSGANNTSGHSNVFSGMGAGESNQTGYDNVYIGRYAGGSGTGGYGNVFLGRSAGSVETGSNKLYIANSNTSTPLIKGTFPNTDLTFTANNVSIVHPIGTSNGIVVTNSYNGNTDKWNIYQISNDNLGLYFNGSARGTWDYISGVYTSGSDIKLKKNIEDFNAATEKIMKLQPKRYNFSIQKDSDKKYIGLIAQDVEKLFPEFVNYNEESDTYTMDYAGLSVVAIQAIKEQQTEIEKLKIQNEDLQKRLENIEKMLKK